MGGRGGGGGGGGEERDEEQGGARESAADHGGAQPPPGDFSPHFFLLDPNPFIKDIKHFISDPRQMNFLKFRPPPHLLGKFKTHLFRKKGAIGLKKQRFFYIG